MQQALNNLKASLTRVRDIANDIDQHAQAALADPALQARHQTTLCATAVILSGFLESFLRDAAEQMIEEICGKGVPFADLPAKIRVTHYWDGGARLQEVARKERKENPLLLAKAADAARRLASPGANQGSYEILWEAFADTQANPGPDQISTFLKRFDVQAPIPTLAAAIQTTENMLVLRLRSFMEIRNECAHTGSTQSLSLTTTDVQGYCDLIEQLGTGIVATLQNLLNQPPFTQSAAPPAAP